MAFVILIYLILVAITSYSSLETATIGVTISGFLSPLIALFGGSGLRGSLYGTKSQKRTGIVVGVIFLAASSLWISKTGFYVTIFDVVIGGGLWVLIGFVVGFIFTTKKHAAVEPEDQNSNNQ